MSSEPIAYRLSAAVTLMRVIANAVVRVTTPKASPPPSPRVALDDMVRPDASFDFTPSELCFLLPISTVPDVGQLKTGSAVCDQATRHRDYVCEYTEPESHTNASAVV
jgi:hypothetical protein